MTLDRAKVEVARSLVRAKSISETIDVALDRLIRALELAVAELPVELDLADDDVDYEALYGKPRRTKRR